jgi:hypothetical protein
MVAQITADGPPAVAPDQAATEFLKKLRDRREMLFRRGFVVFWSTFVIGSLLVIDVGLEAYHPIFNGALIVLLAGLSGLCLFTGLGMMGYAGFLPKTPTLDQLAQPLLPRAEPTTKLPPANYPEQIPSITDRTTRSLEPALLKRSKN